MTKKFSFILVVFFSLLWLSPTLLSQQQESSAELESQSESESESESESQAEATVIEEINVQGQRTTFALRLEIENAETEVYNLFNELNSDDEFDVTCEETIYIGSRLPRRTCMAAYLRKEEAYQTQSYLQGIPIGGGLGSPGSGSLLSFDGVRAEVLEKTEAMEQEMINIANEVPEFAAALIKLANLVGTLEERTNN
ncbi:MAG: hypothetical protein GKR91_11230 [Pseudomonadales bacterium]|nr:hypothetical protein [Pseudomonadales bacterium]